MNDIITDSDAVQTQVDAAFGRLYANFDELSRLFNSWANAISEGGDLARLNKARAGLADIANRMIAVADEVELDTESLRDQFTEETPEGATNGQS